MKPLIIASLCLILSSCQTTVASPPTPLPPTAIAPPPAPTASFGDALAAQIASATGIPPFATVEIAPLQIGRPTIAFPQNQGIVLQIRVSGYPDPKTTQKIVPPLIQIAIAAADRHQLALDGIELVFFRRDTDSPMLVWAATPPWGSEQIFSTSASGSVD